MNNNIYISYSSQDKPIADKIIALFKQKGLNCIFTENKKTGLDHLLKRKERLIKNSTVIVLILSKKSISSDLLLDELEIASKNNIPIVPWRIDDINVPSEFDYYISRYHRIDALSRPLDEEIFQLAEFIIDTWTLKEKGKRFPSNSFNKTNKITLIILFLFAISLISALFFIMDKPNTIIINAPGYYELGNDLIVNDGSGIIVNSSDVFLEGANHRIIGDKKNTHGIGISLLNVQNVTVTNITIKNMFTGLNLNSSNKCQILKNTIENNNNGINIEFSFENIFDDNIINGNKNSGIILASSQFNLLTNNIITNTTNEQLYGLRLAISPQYKNIATANNLIFHNIFNNTNNIGNNHFSFEGSRGSNFWNSPDTISINVGGNYWAMPNNRGYSQKCVNTNDDRFCDESYDISEFSSFSDKDYYPLTDPAGYWKNEEISIDNLKDIIITKLKY